MTAGQARAQPPARPAGRPLRLFMPLALPLVVLAGFAVYTVLTPLEAKPGPPPGKPGALVWGDGIFADAAELKAWLQLHGASYDSWLHAHPAAARMIARRAHRQAAPRAAAARRPQRTRSSAVAVAAAPAPRARGLNRSRLLSIALGALILLLFAAAAAPRRLLARGDGRVWSLETRVLLFAVGLTLLAATAAALLIG